MQMLADMPATLRHVRTVASWDLARAVRARNTLVHQGGYLRHHRLLAVLFDVYELVLRLRLAALKRRPANPDAGFVELAGEVERDFEELATGAYSRQPLRSLCEDGWGSLWHTSSVPGLAGAAVEA